MSYEEFEFYCKEHFPKLNTYDFGIGPGWRKLIIPILSAMNESIDKDGLPLYISQVKEKFGMLRFYSNYTDEIGLIIQNAERKSKNTCEVCGKRAKIIEVDGWFRCLCKGCR